MRLWKNVLVHAAPRPESLPTLNKSLLVAETFDGRVTAFDSIDRTSGQLSLDFPTLSLDALLDMAAVTRTEQIREQVARLKPRVPVETRVGKGTAASELLSYAVSTDTDLIIKTAGARDLLEMTTSGAAALHLLRNSPVPVWLNSPATQANRRVLAAVNLRETTTERAELNRRILTSAELVATLENAELHVLCVADTACDRLYRALLSEERFNAYEKNAERELHARLRQLMTTVRRPAFPHLVHGDAADVLERFVHEHEIDLVVLAGIGRGGLSGVLAEELPEELVCRTDCSVLVLKSKLQLVPLRPPPHRTAPDQQLSAN
jgi:universal stress protein E